MAFPYQQYVEYSNPATPRVFSNNNSNLKTLNLNLNRSRPLSFSSTSCPLRFFSTPSLQRRKSTKSSNSNSSTSNLSPSAPTSTSAPPAPQYRFETMTEEDFIQANATGERPSSGSSSRGGGSGNARRAVSKPPPLHVDTSRRASSSAAASPGPASAPGLGLGPGTGGRVPHARTKAHAQSLSAHPYLRRPQSGSGPGTGAGAGAGVAAGPSGQPQQRALAPVRSARPVSELQSAQTGVGGVSASHTGGALPTVGTPMGVSCPASSSWREGLQLGLSAGHQPQLQAGMGISFPAQVDADATTAAVGGSAGATPQAADAEHDLSASHNLVLPFTLEPVRPRRYGIRADVHFSTEENVITAMFELPGVKRTDLRITMSVCPFSRVRQVTVAGVSRGTLPVQGHQVRERKFGEFFRTLAVPPETKPEDVSVLLEDGILTLKIPGGAPAHMEQPQDIPIPIPASH
uniref:Xyloglucan-specific endo-beta-1,4-glucanase 1 (GH12 protein XEG1)) n=1 Tax=Ganoderma boninense TaxID=34458 RepID=A0A5K1JV20_9APHY|nr:Xyloglucan-specific endo-beta-1,4-glucanase 1 (EC (Glycoside hydrolase family 12 protein XEG1) (GH12 protein XEG1) [Ganoderma boninense]